jgi:transcriptional regulator with XRE-family HTH domain
MDAKELGKFIATLRKEKQITQAELAKRLNVTDKAVSRWERGLGFPDINTLEPLADVLGISMTELMNCKRNDKADISINDANDTIAASIDIAKYQREFQRKKILRGLILSILGIGVIVFCVYVHLKNGLRIVMGGADGPTSVFLVGKIGISHPVIGVLIGCLLIIIGIITIIRTKNNDK